MMRLSVTIDCAASAPAIDMTVSANGGGHLGFAALIVARQPIGS